MKGDRMDKRQDEHSPYYQRPDDLWEESIPGPHWVVAAVLLALALAIVFKHAGQWL